MELKAYKWLREAFLKKHPICQWCEKANPWSPAESVDLHHTRGRAGRLLNDARFFSALCRYHHNCVSCNPSDARKMGFLCEAGKWGSSK